MHDTAHLIGTAFLKLYGAEGARLVVEVGSYDINGTLRDGAPPDGHYVGLDLEPGPGVDIVAAAGSGLPFADGCADLVLASSVFEHDTAFWLTFREMCRIVRPGGYIYISAPSNGYYHRYPLDCWRLYPDAGLALALSSQRDGFPVALVESFVAERMTDIWNDFTAVFQRAGGGPMPAGRLHKGFACRNVHDAVDGGPLQQDDAPQDVRLMQQATVDLAAARHDIAALHAAIAVQNATAAQTLAAAQTRWAAERSMHAAEMRQAMNIQAQP